MQKTESLLVISIIIVLILLTVTVAFIFHIEKKTTLREESVIIDRIDEYIQNGYGGEAEKAILELSRKDMSASSHIRLLKRAWLLESGRAGRGEASGNILEKTAESAYRSYPARKDIAAVYTYALLRRGKHDEARGVYSDAELNGDVWRNLAAEMLLYSSDRDGSEVNGMLQLSRQSGADKFIDIYHSTGAEGFLMDAVLLMLEAGEVDEAYSLVLRNSPEGFSQSFRFFHACDAGQWRAALRILSENPQLFPLREQQLLRADLLMRIRSYDDARESYRAAYSVGPAGAAGAGGNDHDWTAAYNLLYLDLEDDGSLDDDLSMEILRQAEEGFASPVIMDIAGLLIAYGQTDAVQMLLRGYDGGDSRPEIELLQESTRTTVNPERYSSLLWRLVSQEESPEYAIHLAWFLLGLEDFSGLQSLLDYSRKKYGSRSWLEFFQGTVALYQGRYEEAADYFQDSYRMKAHWCSAYNAAAAYMAAGRPDAALEQLELAEVALSAAARSGGTQMSGGRPSTGGTQSSGDEQGDTGDRYDGSRGYVEVLLKRAELYLYGGNYGAARKVLQDIEQYDPNNLQADIYRGMISADTDN
ncbi:MAG: tetratricopeptide repeat protein [Sediminispirochaetaceae bacterium]